MNTNERGLLTFIWALCLVSSIAATAMVLYETAHPLAEPGRQNLWALFSLPYLLLAISAWVLRRRSRALVMMAIGTAVSSLITAVACYQDMTTALYIMESRAAGQMTTSCGPPVGFLALPVSYGIAFLALAASFGLIFRQYRTNQAV